MTAVERCVHTVASLRADHGGPARSITALCTSLSREGVAVDLVALAQQPGEEAPILPNNPEVRATFVDDRNALLSLISQTRFRATVRRVLRDGPVEGTIVHDHGIWLPTNHSTSIVSRQERIPRVVSPRGMLSKWATDFHKWKKSIAWRLFQRSDLHSADMLHVTSTQEADEVRHLGVRVPVAIIPNGVTVPSAARGCGRTHRERLNALFLSRLHPKKGLINLIEAWSIVRPEGWDLTIAGPDDGGHRQVVEGLIQRYDLATRVRLVGSVPDSDKWALYAGSDLFVLPTFSENFGIVIAEALASGLPVITTKAAPWSGLDEHRCGWWIEVGLEPLVHALATATKLSDGERGALGARGRAYVEREFSWARITSKMLRAYEWLLHRGDRPSYVHGP